MKSKLSKGSRSYVILLAFLISLLMIVASFAMIARYKGTIKDEAERIAQQNIQNAAYNLHGAVEVYKSMAENFGSALLGGSYDDEQDFYVQMHRMSNDTRYGNIVWARSYKRGAEFNVNNDEFNIELELPEITAAIDENKLSCIGVVPDRQFNLSSIAYCVPLPGFEYCDAVLVFYWVREVAAYSPALIDANYANSQLAVFCTPEGEIVRILHADDHIDIVEYGDIYDILRKELNDKLFVDEFRVNIEDGSTEKYAKSLSGHDCVFTTSSVMEDDRVILSAVGYYRADDIYPSGYSILQTILGALLVFFLVLLGLCIFTIVQKIIFKRKHAAITDKNMLLGCPSRAKFEKDGDAIIEKNKATSFAVVVIDINHYNYITEQFGFETTIKILKFLELIYSRNLQLDELYGYGDNGRFLLLLHYRDNRMLEQRIHALCALANQRSGQAADNVLLTLFGGVYTTDKGLTSSVSKMIDLAIEAENATRFPYDFDSFRYYNEMLHSSSVQNDYIEMHMEDALKNKDFKVFYQPKYNIEQKRPDGCDALVRWYNSELDEYMQPDVFMSLFEANRFIIKLDHHVFEQVCQYVNDAIANGLPLYPISINASRVTSSETDFVEFYTAMKKKYNIADGFITIEFTESFAYEDYDKMRDIVSVLHQNGFKCSIDDFGSGFSSYNILKELPMDEIKLDRFFIKQGFSHERDLAVLSSVISLARELHMKVTQEGVEHSGEVELLRGLGCQVIQGYYYSKPLSFIDYAGFLESNHVI